MALEEENASCKKLLEHTTDIVNTLKVHMKYFFFIKSKINSDINNSYSFEFQHFSNYY